MDSFDSLNKGDIDSGVAYIGAGLSFGISTMAGASLVFTGPVGWIAAAIGIGFLIVATLLTDNELETIFCNFLLSDTYKKGFSKPSYMLPMEYNRQVLLKKSDLTDDDYLDTLMHPYDVQVALFDAIVCKEIEFVPVGTVTSGGGYNPMTDAPDITTHTTTSFKANMVFSKFFNHERQVECAAYFYHNGMKDSTPDKIIIPRDQIKKIREKTGFTYLQAQFSLPKNWKGKINYDSEFLFVLRLVIDKEKHVYFPYTLKDEERYLAARINMKGDRFMLSDLSATKEVKLLPFDQLIKYETWK